MFEMDTSERISAVLIMAFLLAMIAVQMRGIQKLERSIAAIERKAIVVEQKMNTKQKEIAMELLKCLRDSFYVQCDLNTKMADYMVATQDRVESLERDRVKPTNLDPVEVQRRYDEAVREAIQAAFIKEVSP